MCEQVCIAFIAFPCNARSFAIAILFFFFSFYSLFWMDCQKLSNKRFLIFYKENAWPRSDSILGHTKKSFRRICSWSFYSRHVWHTIQLMHCYQHSQHPKAQETARNLEISLESPISNSSNAYEAEALIVQT